MKKSSSSQEENPSSDNVWMSVPAFWPMAMAKALLQQGTALYAKNLKFVD